MKAESVTCMHARLDIYNKYKYVFWGNYYA